MSTSSDDPTHPTERVTPAGPGSSPTGTTDDAMIGALLDGRFLLKRLLGRGGMGRVFLAQDQRLGRPVAVKLMHSELTREAEFRSRFQREALLQAQAAHPGIVQVLDLGECAEGAYIILEYSEGKSLRAILHRGPPSLERALDLTEQLLEVLEFAHRNGIVHRDLKPGNIMVERDASGRERVRVLDFGLAKVFSSDHGGGAIPQVTLTRPGATFGTLEYMAPEQAAGEVVDHRTDIYAFGVILYEMLTGQVPIRDTTPSGYMRKLFSEPIRPLRETHERLKIPDELDHLVSWCLAKDPDERAPSALVLLQSLREMRRVAEARSSSQIPQTAPEGAAVAARPRSRIFGELGWLFAVLAAAAAGYLYLRGEQQESELRSRITVLDSGDDDVGRSRSLLRGIGIDAASVESGIGELHDRLKEAETGKRQAEIDLAEEKGRGVAARELTSELQRQLEEARSEGPGGALPAIQKEKEALEQQLLVKGGELAKAQEELRQANEERDTLKESRTQIEKQLETARAELQTARTELQGAGGGEAVNQLLSRIESKDRELRQIREQLQRSEQDLTLARNDSSRIQNELNTARNQLAPLRSAEQELRRQLGDRDRSIQELRTQVARRPEIKQPRLRLVNRSGTTVRIDGIRASFIDSATMEFRSLLIKISPSPEIEHGDAISPTAPAQGWNGQALSVEIEYRLYDKTTRRWEYRTPIEGSTTDSPTPGEFTITRR